MLFTYVLHNLPTGRQEDSHYTERHMCTEMAPPGTASSSDKVRVWRRCIREPSIHLVGVKVHTHPRLTWNLWFLFSCKSFCLNLFFMALPSHCWGCETEQKRTNLHLSHVWCHRLTDEVSALCTSNIWVVSQLGLYSNSFKWGQTFAFIVDWIWYLHAAKHTLFGKYGVVSFEIIVFGFIYQKCSQLKHA